MYEAFFGLSVRPFADRPDPDFFFESESHVATLRALYDGLQTQQPILIITGETGCGKTLLSQVMLYGIEGEPVTVGSISNPHTSVRDLTRWAMLSFGQETAGRTDAELREALALFFVSEYGAGRRCLLVIDEAQNLTAEALAGLHEYLDLNAEGDCLLQIVLVAGPRLLQILRDPLLAPWTERLPQISLVGPLGLDEVPRYVQSRLAAAGATREIFTEGAIAAIGVASGGVPRLVNAICDRALAQAHARGRSRIERDAIADVVAEGQAAGLGSLAMLAPVEGGIEDEPPSEPAPLMGAAAASDIAPFVESEIMAAPEPVLAPREAEGAAPPAPPEIRATALQAEFFPIEPEAFFQADFVPPEPAAALPVASPPEAPTMMALQQAPEARHPAGVAGWPSIARNSRLARPGREGAFNAGLASGTMSLRRRFLPRS